MRRAVAIVGSLSMVAASLSFLLLPNATPAAATQPATFLIPATDGYGVGDCLASGADCGRVVATAWCEAQGFAKVATFGLAAPEETTGSTEAAETGRAIAITCES